MANDFEYTGIEVLEAMEFAKNYNKSLLNIVVTRVSKIKNLNPLIVDFGSGNTMYSKMLRRQNDIKPICVELDDSLRKIAEADGFDTYQSVDKLPNKPDLIFSLNVFEHIEDDHSAANEIYKKLKTNGVFIIYVPAFQILYSSMDEKVGHYRRYRLNMLKELLENSNFRVETIQYVDPLGFFAALLYKFFGNKEGTLSIPAVKFFDRYIFPFSKLIQPFTSKLYGKNVYAIAIKD